MLSQEEARALVLQQVERRDDELLVDGKAVPNGWTFYLRARDPDNPLIGRGPILVLSADRKVIAFGSNPAQQPAFREAAGLPPQEPTGCLVKGCDDSRHQDGLCRKHLTRYHDDLRSRASQGLAPIPATSWVVAHAKQQRRSPP